MEINVKVIEIIKLSETAKAIRFIPNKKLDFLPGQFIMLNIELNGEIQKRAFSLSSIPLDNYLEITVKKTKDPFVGGLLRVQTQCVRLVNLILV